MKKRYHIRLFYGSKATDKVAIVDKVDAELNCHKWYINNGGYAYRKDGKGHKISYKSLKFNRALPQI